METILNEKTAETVKRIHLLTTKLCYRNCPNCCNIVCGIDTIPHVTPEELSQCEYLFLTGGEPFKFVNPSEIALFYKRKFKNIKKVFVYGNSIECNEYLEKGGSLKGIDGLSLSIKCEADIGAFEKLCERKDVLELAGGNRCYVFEGLTPLCSGNFDLVERSWQPLETYRPAPDSIFRKM